MEIVFKKAFDHCRSTKVLKNTIQRYILPYNYYGQSFESILLYVK